MSKQIHLNDADGNGQRRTHREAASEDLTPGELIEFGGSDDVQAHSTADADNKKLICLEDHFDGGIDTNISSGDDANVLHCQTGDKVYAFLDSSSSDVSKGDYLVSAGNGNLKAYSAQSVNEGGTDTFDIEPEVIFGWAAEDVTSGASRKRIKVEVK